MKNVLIVLAVLAVVASARVFKVFDGPEQVPRTWRVLGDARPEATMRFTVALKRRNFDVIEEALLKASNPQHPSYGQWWTREQVYEVISPPAEEQQAVAQWLVSHGIQVDVQADAIRCEGSVRAVEKALATKVFAFEQRARKGSQHHKPAERLPRVVYSAMQYEIPEEIEDMVVMVSGVTGFPDEHHLRARELSDAPTKRDDTRGKIVPEVLWDLYNIPDTLEENYPDSSLCLVEYFNDRSFSAEDLQVFEDNTLLGRVTVDNIVGNYRPSFPDGEATLDVQYGLGIVQNASMWYWTTTGWLFDWAVDFIAHEPKPLVVSMSWGWDERNMCDIGNCNGLTAEEYVRLVDEQYAVIGLFGVTIVSSSGDQGAPGDDNPRCKDTSEPISSIFPGASRWVLSIGATMLAPPAAGDPLGPYDSPICQTEDCSTSDTESPCTYPDALITTGGGFSTFIAQPQYQSDVVNTYVSTNNNLPPADAFNASKRGFPDVSAVGHNYLIQYAGSWLLVDGTSASAPVWGGIVARWNAYRLKNNLPSLGFINPLIYQMNADGCSGSSCFTDITSGNNDCTESCCGVGYDADNGWDPVTGLGTPNYDLMFNYITSM
mmetsp:Transcript_30096/g.84067  ORF Transcript_30096/g.84067 Transcript_30096/m.84067 type:complete len:603 (+) Transcript_30096:104-1912(+)|eukprot:CAMPEP_0119119360 /NCGR_PEP_ID=MMETSP1310-20130426/882_1 /TAXON_ID=464262 /ORGANISM="Genus nov. species nov., Strain RCC2339" /LENGTH=602 /DNA_ID=CAMNT_0007108789 /DNA_START=104 /DNA_END=1912 /DNA_ORIENTATION=+